MECEAANGNLVALSIYLYPTTYQYLSGSGCLLEKMMTNRIGNKDVAQQRSKKDKREIKLANIAREAIKKSAARAKYHKAVKGQGSGGVHGTASPEVG